MPDFVSPVAFVSVPVAPRFTTGRVVIHSDDGTAGDYTHWFPEFQAKHRVSQFLGKRLAPLCPSINSATIGGTNRMAWANVRAIEAAGGEILSHGRYHLGYRDYPLIAAADEGAEAVTVLEAYGSRVNGTAYGADPVAEGITHEIVEGEVAEIVTVTGNTAGVLSLAAPLANAFTTAAVLRLSEAAMLANITGCSDDAEAEGIAPIRHHVWTWHDRSATAKARVSTIMDSARAGDQQVNDPASTVDFYDLDSRVDEGLTEASIDTFLDTVQSTDGVLIVYGHGGTGETAVSNLRYLIAQCIARGIRIVTHSEAVAYLQASD